MLSMHDIMALISHTAYNCFI